MTGSGRQTARVVEPPTTRDILEAFAVGLRVLERPVESVDHYRGPGIRSTTRVTLRDSGASLSSLDPELMSEGLYTLLTDAGWDWDYGRETWHFNPNKIKLLCEDWDGRSSCGPDDHVATRLLEVLRHDYECLVLQGSSAMPGKEDEEDD